MALKKIIPSPLSRKFTGIDGPMIEYLEEKTNNGEKRLRSLGEYNRERLPGSTQGERTIIFSNNKKKYLIKGYETNSAELDELVAKCKLFNDMKKHPDFGKYITSCDIHNAQDPFFNNLKLRIKLDQGYGTFNTESPIEHLLYLGALLNSRFQIGGENLNPALNGRAKYIIVDAEIDKEVRKKSKDNKKKAEKIIENASDDKKRSMALVLGLTKSQDTDIDMITDLLEDVALDDKMNYDLGMSKQAFLIKIGESESEELESRKYVDLAFKRGLVKRDKDTSLYMLFGMQIGKEKQNVIDYLMNPINNEILHKLIKAIDLTQN